MDLLLRDTVDLVLLDSILLKIILLNNQEDHLAKDKGLSQDLVTMHHTHTKVDRREVSKEGLLCKLNGDNNGLRCSNSSRGNKGEGLQCSNSSHRSNSKVLMVSNILLTTNSSSNTRLDLNSSSSSSNRDPITRQTILLGINKPQCW